MSGMRGTKLPSHKCLELACLVALSLSSPLPTPPYFILCSRSPLSSRSASVSVCVCVWACAYIEIDRRHTERSFGGRLPSAALHFDCRLLFGKVVADPGAVG